MKRITKEMYQCEHCTKWYHREHAAINHEKACFHNPENKRACIDCKHCQKESFLTTSDEDEKNNLEVSTFYCEKIDSAIYPPKVEHKGNAYELDGIANSPMPKECKHKEVSGYFEDSIEEFIF